MTEGQPSKPISTNTDGKTTMHEREIQVEAPANLEAGYTFEATFQGKNFLVTVPEGGIIKGQTFMAPFPNVEVIDKTGKANSQEKACEVPRGKWRDGLFRCFKQGPCDPMLCTAIWCTPVALAQVMTRMGLTFLAQPASPKERAKNTVPSVLLVVVAFFLCLVTFGAIPSLEWLVTLGWIAFTVYFVSVGIVTRHILRTKYDIPGSGLEDCCSLFWCSCCTVTQMGHHTHDYGNHPGVCFSRTGLVKTAPDIV